MERTFHSFSPAHFAILGAFALITLVLIRLGKRRMPVIRYRMALVLACITFFSLVAEAIVLIAERDYDVITDLPLNLCDLITLMLPFVIFTRNRTWVGILYFWALAGTLQALITPDIDRDFPSFHFFRYFIMHCGIVMTVLFFVINWKINIRWRDWVNAVMLAQVYLVLIHVYNLITNSNYSYTVRKPEGKTILDAFGEWPWYILGGELIMMVLFALLMLPYLGGGQRAEGRGHRAEGKGQRA
jgi:hypothetical integral membrane protein (TIGR02206 family)